MLKIISFFFEYKEVVIALFIIIDLLCAPCIFAVGQHMIYAMPSQRQRIINHTIHAVIWGIAKNTLTSKGW